MLKSVTKILEDEHKIAREIVLILDKTAEDLKSKKSVSLFNLKELISSVEKTLEAHHKKEMEVFSCLTTSQDISAKTLIGILSEEHNLGYEYIANMFKIIDHKSRDEQEKFELLPFHMEKYSRLLINHIEKEEREFFPLIETNIKKEELEKLMRAFQKIDNNLDLKRASDNIKKSKTVN